MGQVDRVQEFCRTYIKGPARDLLIVARDWKGAGAARDSMLRIPGAKRLGLLSVRFENGTVAFAISGQGGTWSIQGIWPHAALVHVDAGLEVKSEAVERTQARGGKVEFWVTP